MKVKHTPSRQNRICEQPKSRVFLVEDHPITRRGLAEVINHEPGLRVCGQAGTAEKALVGIPVSKPDLAIVDLALAQPEAKARTNGLRLIKDIAARFPRLSVLVYSTHDEALYAERALRAGAKGYVMKQQPVEQLIEAIHQVLRGELYLNEAVRAKLVHKHLRDQSDALTATRLQPARD